MTRRYTTTQADVSAGTDTASRPARPTRDAEFEADLAAFRRASLCRRRISRVLEILVGASLLALFGMLVAGMIRPSLILNDPEEVNRAAAQAKAKAQQKAQDAETKTPAKAPAEKHASTSPEGRLVLSKAFSSVFFARVPEVRAAMSASDAVTAANGMQAPDANDVIGSTSTAEMLGGFGSGDLGLVEDQTKLYQGGYGSLFNPAADRVVVCRNENDPECLAVQELDHGFPERYCSILNPY